MMRRVEVVCRCVSAEPVGMTAQVHLRSISPHAPLLAGFFTALLCRHNTLSAHGRTLSAVVIGLGDEGVGEYTDMNSRAGLILDQIRYTPRLSWFTANGPSPLSQSRRPSRTSVSA